MATPNSHERDSTNKENEHLGSLPGRTMIPQPSRNKLIVQLLGPSGRAGSTPIGIGLDGLFADIEQEGILPGAEYTFDMRVPRWWLEAELSRLSAAEQPLGAANPDLERLSAAQNASSIPVLRRNSYPTTIVRSFELPETETTFISPWKSPPKKSMDFMKFPPEIRNMIYELLLELGEPIPITSPALGRGSNRRLKRRFTSLFGVSKKIGEEARTTFYSCNTWVVGNGQWGSRRQPNRHALKIFLERIPRYAIAWIRRLQIDIHFTNHPWAPRSAHKMYPRDVTNLEGLSRSIVKYFKRVGKINVVSGGVLGSYILDVAPTLTTGPVSAMTRLFEMPNLKKIIFLDNAGETSFQNVVYGMLEGESGEKAREKSVVVKVAKGILGCGDGYWHGQWDME